MFIYRLSKPKIFFLLLFASIIIFSNSLNGDFILDDRFLIVNNPLIKHISSLPLLFVIPTFNQSDIFTHYENSYVYYRPFMVFSFAIDYSIWRLNPFGYHFTNIIIHSLNAYLIFLLIYELFTNFPLALLTSVFFAVHPIHSQSVSYITNRGELLANLFALMALILYIRFIKLRKNSLYIISLLSFISAFFSCEAVFLISLPLFISFIGMKFIQSKIKILMHFIAYAGIIVIYAAMRFTILAPLEMVPSTNFPILGEILNLLAVLSTYFKLLVFPYPLFVMRTIFAVSSFKLWQSMLLISFSLFLITVSVILGKTKKDIPFFGIAWFILILLPLIRFMHKIPGYLSVEEHWAYLASIGFFIVLAHVLLSINQAFLRRFLPICIIIVFSFLAFVNNGHWKDEINFYRYNLKFTNPHVGIMLRSNFITALSKRKLYEEALQEARSMLLVAPGNPVAYIKLGDILKDTGYFEKAKEAYRDALKIDYFCWQARRKLKHLSEEMGQVYNDEINLDFLSAAELNIVSLIGMGYFHEALTALEKELIVHQSPSLYTLAGITFGKMGLLDRAIEAFNAALSKDENYFLALHNLAITYEKKQNPKKAAQIRNRISLSQNNHMH